MTKPIVGKRYETKHGHFIKIVSEIPAYKDGQFNVNHLFPFVGYDESVDIWVFYNESGFPQTESSVFRDNWALNAEYVCSTKFVATITLYSDNTIEVEAGKRLDWPTYKNNGAVSVGRKYSVVRIKPGDKG